MGLDLRQAADVAGDHGVGAGVQDAGHLAVAQLPGDLGWTRLYTPADPQHIPPSFNSSNSTLGTPASNLRGWSRTPWACNKWQAS